MGTPVLALEEPDNLLRSLRDSSVGLVLEQEGLVNDLSFHVNRLRREREYGVSDSIRLSIACGVELWWAIHFNESRLLESVKAESITFVEEFPRELYYFTRLAYDTPVAIHTIRA